MMRVVVADTALERGRAAAAAEAEAEAAATVSWISASSAAWSDSPSRLKRGTNCRGCNGFEASLVEASRGGAGKDACARKSAGSEFGPDEGGVGAAAGLTG